MCQKSVELDAIPNKLTLEQREVNTLLRNWTKENNDNVCRNLKIDDKITEADCNQEIIPSEILTVIFKNCM